MNVSVSQLLACNCLNDMSPHSDEFGQWRPVCNRFGAEYLNAYHDYVKISVPEEDYDGRLGLYKLRVYQSW